MSSAQVASSMPSGAPGSGSGASGGARRRLATTVPGASLNSRTARTVSIASVTGSSSSRVTTWTRHPGSRRSSITDAACAAIGLPSVRLGQRLAGAQERPDPAGRRGVQHQRVDAGVGLGEMGHLADQQGCRAGRARSGWRSRPAGRVAAGRRRSPAGSTAADSRPARGARRSGRRAPVRAPGAAEADRSGASVRGLPGGRSPVRARRAPRPRRPPRGPSAARR